VDLIRDIYAAKREAGKPAISFEFFPPKTPEGDRALFEKTLPALARLEPDFCSVTYGAGGSTRDKTLGIVERIQREFRLTTLAHLTCVGSTREEIGALLDRIKALGCRNILALRGDPPGGGEFKAVPGGFHFAAGLVRFIRERGDFSIGVAGFPEGHPACGADRAANWDHLRAKIDAGADFVITQLFFDNADFLAMRDHLVRHGVTVPLVPGIIPILSNSQIQKFTSLGGAKIPSALQQKLDELGADDEAVAAYGIKYASTQCAELLKAGAPGIHFYPLNKAAAVTQILQNLGLARG
jgi:methylenetetrahydrofolate reductase (NADPH)